MNEAHRARTIKQIKAQSEPQIVRTFLADEGVSGCAGQVVEFPSVLVLGAADVNTVFIILPVIRLVRLPGKKVLQRPERTDKAPHSLDMEHNKASNNCQNIVHLPKLSHFV